jgi:hypothetical protein
VKKSTRRRSPEFREGLAFLGVARPSVLASLSANICVAKSASLPVVDSSQTHTFSAQTSSGAASLKLIHCQRDLNSDIHRAFD